MFPGSKDLPKPKIKTSYLSIQVKKYIILDFNINELRINLIKV